MLSLLRLAVADAARICVVLRTEAFAWVVVGAQSWRDHLVLLRLM